MADSKINSFENLVVWQKAQDLAVEIYQLTKRFTADEKFALTDQIKRASTSISANVAEGFGRRSKKDRLHFYTMSYGSLLEVKNFLYLAERLEYLHATELEKLLVKVTDCQKLLNAFVRSLNASS